MGLGYSDARPLVMALACVGLMLGASACTKSINVDNSDQGTSMGGAPEAGESGNPDDVPDDVLAVSGVVSDFDTGAPLKNAVVNCLVGQVRTNAQGQYLFDVTGYPGLEAQVGSEPVRFTASAPGYQQDYVTIVVKSGHNRSVDIGLMRAADTHRILLEPESLVFDAADFGDGDSATKSVDIGIESTSEEEGPYTVTIRPEARAWLTLGDGQEMGTASSLNSAFVDFNVDKSSLTASTQTNVSIEVGASTKQLLVKVTLP